MSVVRSPVVASSAGHVGLPFGIGGEMRRRVELEQPDEHLGDDPPAERSEVETVREAATVGAHVVDHRLADELREPSVDDRPLVVPAPR